MNKTLLLFGIAGALLLIYAVKRAKPLDLLLCALCGVAALIGVGSVGHLWGMHLPVNAFTAAVGALGGIPGVILLVLLNTFTAA